MNEAITDGMLTRAEYERELAEVHKLNQETRKLMSEASKLDAETRKLANEASKLDVESKKLAGETRWYLLVVGSGATLAIVAIAKLFL
ncbi:hypothetical protein [Paracoccus sp. SCSIO 75233]|uniref:hypothetical protein n=1 Tax=Paracoccus sp. SCSIO 75233 TaxID=3017782 RepID=UPI0022F03BBF|nr:hypothetical protein [Paracoccus sp. SCSIO 75233]WBU51776.1 hypothetical protein PAF12_07910 [Paracoccus sp. SCSIO 75233]